MVNYCCVPKCGGKAPDFRMFRFPTASDRRDTWLKIFGRRNWIPKVHSRICEKHFDDTQFENSREDNWRKLRPNAIPTVFNSIVIQPSKRRMKIHKEVSDHKYSRPSDGDEISQPTDDELCQRISERVDEEESVESCHRQQPGEEHDRQQAGKELKRQIKEQQLKIRRLKRLLKQSQQREENLQANVAKFLNKDQLERLKLPPHDKGFNIVWSDETVQRCLAIRSVVGRNGYEYLRALKFPLPSYRTLCKRVENSRVATGVMGASCDVEEQVNIDNHCVLPADNHCVLPALLCASATEFKVSACVDNDFAYVESAQQPAEYISADEEQSCDNSISSTECLMLPSAQQTEETVVSAATCERIITEPYVGESETLLMSCDDVPDECVPLDECYTGSLRVSVDEMPVDFIGGLEGNALYDLSGWAVSCFLSTVNCETCTVAFSTNSLTDDWLGQFTETRSYGGLTHPTSDIVDAVKIAEEVFKANLPTMHTTKNVEKDITSRAVDVLETVGYSFPDCHKGLFHIVNKYIRVRSHAYASSVT